MNKAIKTTLWIFHAIFVSAVCVGAFGVLACFIDLIMHETDFLFSGRTPEAAAYFLANYQFAMRFIIVGLGGLVGREATRRGVSLLKRENIID